eukprot:EG_transcript_44010
MLPSYHCTPRSPAMVVHFHMHMHARTPCGFAAAFPPATSSPSSVGGCPTAVVITAAIRRGPVLLLGRFSLATCSLPGNACKDGVAVGSGACPSSSVIFGILKVDPVLTRLPSRRHHPQRTVLHHEDALCRAASLKEMFSADPTSTLV